MTEEEEVRGPDNMTPTQRRTKAKLSQVHIEHTKRMHTKTKLKLALQAVNEKKRGLYHYVDALRWGAGTDNWAMPGARRYFRLQASAEYLEKLIEALE